MGSISWNGFKLNQIYQYQITIFYLNYAPSSFAYKYLSVNGISLGLAQSDPIKRRLLFEQNFLNIK